MKKRIVSTLLAWCLVLVLLPDDGLAKENFIEKETVPETPSMGLSLLLPEPAEPIIAGTTITLNAHIDCNWLYFDFHTFPEITASDDWSVTIDGNDAKVSYIRPTSPAYSQDCKIKIVLPQNLDAGQHTISFTARKGVLYSHWSEDPEEGIPEEGLTAELSIQAKPFEPKLIIEGTYSSYEQNSNDSDVHTMRVVCENASFSRNALDVALWNVVQPNDLEIIDIKQRESNVVDTSSLVWIHFSRPFKNGERITITVDPTAFDTEIVNSPSGTFTILLDNWPVKPENISLEFTEGVPTSVTWTLPEGNSQPKSYQISIWENPASETGQRRYCDEFDTTSVDVSPSGKFSHELKLTGASEMSWNPELWNSEEIYMIDIVAQGTNSVPWKEVNVSAYWKANGTDSGEHTHSYSSIVTPPTCTEKGYTTYTCECGDTYLDNETLAVGHSYGGWTVVREATETHTGLRERSCGVCGNIQSEIIPKLDSEPSEPSRPSKPSEKPSKPEKPTEEPAKPEKPAEPETPVQPQEPVTPAPVYADVTPDAWYNEAATYVASKGLMTGTSEGNFSPNEQMTRAMVWTVLGRMAGADVAGSGSEWYAKAQAWAAASGVSDGANPNGGVTRQELAVMLWRSAGSPEGTAEMSAFSDGGEVAEWASAAMRWAVANGVLNGDNGALKPGAPASRAEVAAMLMRFCEKMGL